MCVGPAVCPPCPAGFPELRQCFQHPEGCMLIPILQMGKLRLVEEK